MFEIFLIIAFIYLVFAFLITMHIDSSEISKYSFGRRVVKKTSGAETWYELQQMTPFFNWIVIKPFFSRARETGKFLSEAEPKKYLDEYNKKIENKKKTKTEVIK